MSIFNMILSLYIFVNILLVNIYGVRVKIQARSLPNRNDVALQCTDDSDDEVPLVTTNIGLFRTSNDQSSTELFTDFIFEAKEARFIIRPEIEGNYSCIDQDTNTTSSNTVAVIATPTIDPDYIIPSVNYALIGSNVILPCSYPIGILTQYYTVTWYIGSTIIDISNPHYEIMPDLSLSINNVLLNDNSDGYYCEISVQEPNNDMIYSEYGYDTTLIVFDDLDLYSNTLNDTIVSEGISSIVFTCITHSIPPGTVRWLIHGTYITTNNTRYTTSKQVNMTSSIAIVTSQLVINNPIPSDSGVIQCVGYINNGVDIIFESSQATLTVIGNSFTPVIAVTNNGSLLLSITLPAIITQLFNIHIRYINNNVTIHDQILTNSLFYNTATIDHYMIDTITIPFNSFAVAIAIEINGIIGEYTTLSNTIVLPDSSDVTIVTTSMTSSSILTTYSSVQSSSIIMSSNTLTCDTCSCNSNIPFIIIIIILIVLLLTASFVIPIVICINNRKRSSKRIDSLELKITNPSVYTKDISTCTSQTTHEDDSHTPSVTGDSHSPSVTDDSRSCFTGIDEHNHSYTPSRPSSQESFYPDKSRTVSPMPHIYENEYQNNTNIESNVIEKENRTMSSIAVGTSPPRDGKEIIISFMKGQSESPKRTEDRHTGVLSPARSDPSLESSLKFDYSKKKIFTESVPIPKGPDTRDQDTIMSPTDEEPIVQSCTYQQKMYGSNKPPVLAEEPKKEDEKIYQKIIKEYDVV